MHLNINDFKSLLVAVKAENIGIKVRTHTGWSKNYLRIIGFISSSERLNRSFNGIILSNQTETEGILINNISTIIEFELEQPWKFLKAQTVYPLTYNHWATMINH